MENGSCVTFWTIYSSVLLSNNLLALFAFLLLFLPVLDEENKER
jgi:hypothetical protein